MHYVCFIVYIRTGYYNNNVLFALTITTYNMLGADTCYSCRVFLYFSPLVPIQPQRDLLNSSLVVSHQSDSWNPTFNNDEMFKRLCS